MERRRRTSCVVLAPEKPLRATYRLARGGVEGEHTNHSLPLFRQIDATPLAGMLMSSLFNELPSQKAREMSLSKSFRLCGITVTVERIRP